MAATIAMLLAMIGVLVLGAGVFFVGVAGIVTARRRSAAVGVPIVATGVGAVIVLSAAALLVVTATMHLSVIAVTVVR